MWGGRQESLIRPSWPSRHLTSTLGVFERFDELYKDNHKMKRAVALYNTILETLNKIRRGS